MLHTPPPAPTALASRPDPPGPLAVATPTTRKLADASLSVNTRRAYLGALARLDAWRGASGRKSVSQDVSSDVRLSMTRNARAWRAGMVTTGAAVNPIKTAALYRVSPATILDRRCDPPGELIRTFVKGCGGDWEHARRRLSAAHGNNIARAIVALKRTPQRAQVVFTLRDDRWVR